MDTWQYPYSKNSVDKEIVTYIENDIVTFHFRGEIIHACLPTDDLVDQWITASSQVQVVDYDAERRAVPAPKSYEATEPELPALDKAAMRVIQYWPSSNTGLYLSGASHHYRIDEVAIIDRIVELRPDMAQDMESHRNYILIRRNEPNQFATRRTI